MSLPQFNRWSGSYHIVNTRTGESLESWWTGTKADFFCGAVNDHEEANGRGRPYAVESHPVTWRGRSVTVTPKGDGHV